MVRVKPTNRKGEIMAGTSQLGGKKIYIDAPDQRGASLDQAMVNTSLSQGSSPPRITQDLLLGSSFRHPNTLPREHLFIKGS
jgi:hypothetical protein